MDQERHETDCRDSPCAGFPNEFQADGLEYLWGRKNGTVKGVPPEWWRYVRAGKVSGKSTTQSIYHNTRDRQFRKEQTQTGVK